MGWIFWNLLIVRSLSISFTFETSTQTNSRLKLASIPSKLNSFLFLGFQNQIFSRLDSLPTTLTSSASLLLSQGDCNVNDNEVFVRARLPTNLTTVLRIQRSTPLSTVFTMLCDKKQLSPSGHYMKIFFEDGREEPPNYDKLWSDYQNIKMVGLLSDLNNNPVKYTAGGGNRSYQFFFH